MFKLSIKFDSSLLKENKDSFTLACIFKYCKLYIRLVLPDNISLNNRLNLSLKSLVGSHLYFIDLIKGNPFADIPISSSLGDFSSYVCSK